MADDVDYDLRIHHAMHFARVLVDNMNSITESASLDHCADETLWSHMGFGSEVIYRLVGKP
eukprot:15364666-Ditylum_brightwellii.AAC.1